VEREREGGRNGKDGERKESWRGGGGVEGGRKWGTR
jgi:hypothetical protein